MKQSRTKKVLLLLPFALVFAFLFGSSLGRGLAWLTVYSQPSRPRAATFRSCICHFSPDPDSARSIRQKRHWL
jgi:hypothetical protein